MAGAKARPSVRLTFIAVHAPGARAGIAEIAPYLPGRDPHQVDRTSDAMDAALSGHNHAKSAIDLACRDVFGKSVNMPVCELPGGSTGSGYRYISQRP